MKSILNEQRRSSIAAAGSSSFFHFLLMPSTSFPSQALPGPSHRNPVYHHTTIPAKSQMLFAKNLDRQLHPCYG